MSIVQVFTQDVIDAVHTLMQFYLFIRLRSKVIENNVVKLELAKPRIWRLYHGLTSYFTKMQESHEKTGTSLAKRIGLFNVLLGQAYLV